jgi:succinate-semialdehyde dehydrogenase/glutarate-semialdehyde dehydrogenase
MRSINPLTGEQEARWPLDTQEQVEQTLARAEAGQRLWRGRTLSERSAALMAVAQGLGEEEEALAIKMMREMGKPLSQARAEVGKCALVCEHYARWAEGYLAEEEVDVGEDGAVLQREPLGVILSIMPWNFPYWQVFRFVAPALMAGNTVVVKHAPRTQGCAELLKKLVDEAGLPQGVVSWVRVPEDRVPPLIADPRIAAVTVTGSERAGRAVAQVAGAHLKKCVLELGGSDAFIVLGDANIEEAARAAVLGRVLNTGQSCIASKRFLVEASVAQDFTAAVLSELARLTVGDPAQEETDLGPLAREDLAVELERQVKESVELGARVLCGGHRDGRWFEPTLLVDVPLESPAGQEEMFGPVASLWVVEDEEEAVRLANATRFGLAACVWTGSVDRGRELAHRLDVGGVFVNRLPLSDPRLPFGGVKASGYGRELGRAGILEFTNLKTVRWARDPTVV